MPISRPSNSAASIALSSVFTNSAQARPTSVPSGDPDSASLAPIAKAIRPLESISISRSALANAKPRRR
jgi:hypothetical protein